jgi:hypothetical protein
MDLAAHFALFVSAVDGQPVTRFGTRTLVGASRRQNEPTIIDYDPSRVIAISRGEYARYRREYERAIRDGSLTRRTVEDWQAQNAPPPAAPPPSTPPPTQP